MVNKVILGWSGHMSCNDPWFTYFYKHSIPSRRKKRSAEYNWLTRRYKRRNRRPRYSCKKHKDFCVLMSSLYGKLDLPYLWQTDLDIKTLEKVRKLLQPFLLWLKRHYELVLLSTNPDYRSGFETYGYISDDDDTTDAQYVLNQLDYISDRWQCSFRVRWLINLLEPEYDGFKDTEKST